MRRKRGWTGLRPTVLALGFVAATAGGVRAANIPPTTPVLAYNTVGSGIDNSDTVGGTPTISFTPLLGSSFLAPSSLSFGKFLVSALPDGQTTTYSNTPFHIKLNATAVDGSAPDPNGTPLAITGKLNGSVIGSTQSSVMATFDPLALSSFQTGAYTNGLQLPSAPVWVVPSTSNGGETTIQAFLTSAKTTPPPAGQTGGTPGASAVPEPSTVILFAATIVGLGARQRLLVRRVG